MKLTKRARMRGRPLRHQLLYGERAKQASIVQKRRKLGLRSPSPMMRDRERISTYMARVIGLALNRNGRTADMYQSSATWRRELPSKRPLWGTRFPKSLEKTLLAKRPPSMPIFRIRRLATQAEERRTGINQFDRMLQRVREKQAAMVNPS